MKSVVYAGAAYWVQASQETRTQGLFRLADDSGGWRYVGGGLPDPVEVRTIVVRPGHPDNVYVGTQVGPYVSEDGGESWRAMALPGKEKVVWSILLHPTDPKTIYVGTENTEVFRSRDGGESFEKLPTFEPVGYCKMGFNSRVIRLALDPSDPDTIYAGLEVGGVLRSLDGGDSWEDCNPSLLKLAEEPHLKSQIGSDTDTEGMMDSHSLTVSPAHPGSVILATRMGLFRSDDKGSNWYEMDIGRYSPLTYARDVQVSPHDPETMHAALSVAAVSDAGSLYRSQDFGQTWKRFDHDVEINSTLMIVATTDRSPDRVWCAARRGQVFGTEDGGKSWLEFPLPPDVEGVYALACA
jgi:Sortilin, neurotensin receptor 3,/BNR/Asp-box repeat